MSSLSERLHHTVNQYVLPSSGKFVSHGEYIYPVILLLLPLVVRCVSLAFGEIERFDFGGALGALGVAFGAAVLLGVVGSVVGDASVVVNYVIVGLWLFKLGLLDWINRLLSSSKEEAEEEEEEEREQGGTDTTTLETTSVRRGRQQQRQQSIQFTACVLSIYMHVPIALTHVSLAIPSVLFWTPLLAFPTYRRHPATTKATPKWAICRAVIGWVRHIFALAVLVCIWPPTAVVLLGLGGVSCFHYVYFSVVFVPLYLLLSILWLC